IPVETSVVYWAGTRSQYVAGEEYELEDQVYLVAQGLHGEDESDFIDLTPGSTYLPYSDREDAALPVGQSYYDSRGGLTLTTVAAGGTAPNRWVDLRVDFDPLLFLSESALWVNESQPRVIVEVQRVDGTNLAAEVGYRTADGEALAGLDYTSTTGRLVWAAGDVDPKYIAIPILSDAEVESREAFSLMLENPAGARLAAGRSEVAITIRDGSDIENTPGHRYSWTSGPWVNPDPETRNTTGWYFANQADGHWWVDYAFSGRLAIDQTVLDGGFNRHRIFSIFEFEQSLGNDGHDNINMFGISGYWDWTSPVPNVLMNLTTGEAIDFVGTSFDDYGGSELDSLVVHWEQPGRVNYALGDILAWVGRGSVDIGEDLGGDVTRDIQRSTWNMIENPGVTKMRYR
ncbi:MAG: Calx-beta domain-containing protein, partial [Verrucomicrobiota bacterium]